MGNAFNHKKSKKTFRRPTKIALQQAMKSLLEQSFDQISLSQSIEIILSELKENLPLSVLKGQVNICKPILIILTHRRFQSMLTKILSLAIKKIQQLFQSSALVFVNDEDLIDIKCLIQFLVAITDSKILEMIQCINHDINFDSETKEAIQKINQLVGFEKNGPLLSKLASVQVQLIHQVFIQLLIQIYQLRVSIFTHSQSTQLVIQQIEQSTYMLYLRIFFSKKHRKFLIKKICKKENKQHFMELFQLGSYFMLKGINNGKLSLFQVSVMLLTTLLQKGKHFTQQLQNTIPLPSHLFPRLPKTNCYNLCQQIIFYSIMTLCSSISNSFFSSIKDLDRIEILTLVSRLTKFLQKPSDEIEYFLEQLALKSNNDSLEFAYVMVLINEYLRRVNRLQSVEQKYKILITAAHKRTKHFYVMNLGQKLGFSCGEAVQIMRNNISKLFLASYSAFSHKFLYQEVLNSQITVQYYETIYWKLVVRQRQTKDKKIISQIIIKDNSYQTKKGQKSEDTTNINENDESHQNMRLEENDSRLKQV